MASTSEEKEIETFMKAEKQYLQEVKRRFDNYEKVTDNLHLAKSLHKSGRSLPHTLKMYLIEGLSLLSGKSNKEIEKTIDSLISEDYKPIQSNKAFVKVHGKMFKEF